MKQNQEDRKLLRLHSFQVPCALHGQHRYVLGGLDHGVDDAAFHLLKTLKRNRYQVQYDCISIPLEEARSAFSEWDGDYDDLPF
jgi:hypothetical protein